jgi:hypothetical protein
MVLASLVFSDLAAMRHLGSCCGDGVLLASGQAVQAGRVDAAGVCGHHGCDHGNPFRRHVASEPIVNDPIASNRDASCPCAPAHDRDSCAVCRWFVVISTGMQIDAVITVEFGELVAEPVVVATGLPGRMMFLPTVSRRGPPAVA